MFITIKFIFVLFEHKERIIRSCGVRSSLLPLLIKYFQCRKILTKLNGFTRVPRNLNGSGPKERDTRHPRMLVTDKSQCRLFGTKFLDYLTVIEILNPLTVGLTSNNVKQHVASELQELASLSIDILFTANYFDPEVRRTPGFEVHCNEFIPEENLQSETHLNQINDWSLKQQMKINENRNEIIILNS